MEQESGAAMFSADFKERAFQVYAAMREKGPVASITLPTGEPIWFVTRYAEVMAFLKDDERFANDPSSALTEEEYALLFQQATEHLTPEQQEMEAQIDEILRRHLLARRSARSLPIAPPRGDSVHAEIHRRVAAARPGGCGYAARCGPGAS